MDERQHIHEDIAAIRRHAANDPNKGRSFDLVADKVLVLYATTAMREKLKAARAKGLGGWWNDKECSIDQLRSLLREQVDKGDMRDVLNLAAMVYVREIADVSLCGQDAGPTAAVS